MTSPPRGFVNGLASHPPDRFEAFVAALQRARGREVDRSGGTLRVRNPDDGSVQTLATLPSEANADVPPGADVVVTADDPAVVTLPEDTLVWGPADLYEQARYAVEGDGTDRLLERFFETPVVSAPERTTLDPRSNASASESEADRPARGELREPDPDSIPAKPATGDPLDSDARRVAESGADAPAESDDATSSASSRLPTLGPDGRAPSRRSVVIAGGAFVAGFATATASVLRSDADTAAGEPASPAAGESVAPSVTAPGLTANGVEDPNGLVLAHLDQLAEASYEITSTRTVHAGDGRLRSLFSVEVARGGTESFFARVSTNGEHAPSLVGEPPGYAEFWSNGVRYLRRLETTSGHLHTEYQPRSAAREEYFWTHVVPFGGRPYSALNFYVDLFENVPTVVANPDSAQSPPYRVFNETEGAEPPPIVFLLLDGVTSVHDVDVAGVVESTGLLRSLEFGYRADVDDTPVDVRWSIEYDEVGEVEVNRPEWYRAAVEGNDATRI